MKKKTLWVTETAVMLALLVTLQWATKPLGQIVTGSCVNAVLAVSALLCGLSSGLTVALLSPLFAYFLGIAPNVITIPVIMAGNSLFVLLLSLLKGKPIWKNIIAWLTAAAGKFAVMYALVVWVVCGVASDFLLAQGVLKAPMLKALPLTFGATQLITALIGTAVALLIAPVVRKGMNVE